MRFGTRTFLVSIGSSALLLAGSFWTVHTMVLSTVREQLRTSLRENHAKIARMRQSEQTRIKRLVDLAGESPVLKAGMQLSAADPTDTTARLTLEDQLSEMCATLGFDILQASSPTGKRFAGVMFGPDGLKPIDAEHTPVPGNSLMLAGGVAYQISSVPLTVANQKLGTLYVGDRYDFSDFQSPIALFRDGKLQLLTVPGVKVSAAANALEACGVVDAECDVSLNGDTWTSLPVDTVQFGPGLTLRSLQNFDAAARPVNVVLRRAFYIAFAGAMVFAMLFGALSSRSISNPLGELVSHLSRAELAGTLQEFRNGASSVDEIRALAAGFNRAAAAIRMGQDDLNRAYLEFVSSLARALDARDGYTAGHSQRVSDLACLIALHLSVPADQIEQIRVGALLHDIGKIGVPDEVLKKPGHLTIEEFRLIQQHPVIGRRILENVEGFAPYLGAVELHHENWDGSGYPHGLQGREVPLDARIIHVADAYDAMTTSRPYRRGMTEADAMRVLAEFAGRQFDPDIVEVLQVLEMPSAHTYTATA